MTAFLAHCLLAAYGERYEKVRQVIVLALPARKNSGMHLTSGACGGERDHGDGCF